MPRARKIAACDAETDPFLKQRVPKPFLWGFYDGKQFLTFKTTKEFVAHIKNLNIILYAHNGGKFDFIFLLEFIGRTRLQMINGRIVSMMLGECELRDSYSIMPVPLRELGAKKEIEMSKLEANVRKQHMPEIIEYLRMDCVSLFDAVEAYRTAAGKHKTLASNALSFARKLGCDPGKTSFRFDKEYRQFYYGGRTQCFKPGEHKNLVMLDIHSAYPFAMSHDHATGTALAWRDNFKGMSRDEICRSFVILSCHAKGCFPVRSNGLQGIHFPDGDGIFYVTGWEYVAAKELNLISNVEIKSVRTTTETINFKPYVEHWYAEKLRHSARDAYGDRIDKANYTISKTMMNSLYGKLAQNPARYYDYKIEEAGTPLPCKMTKGKCTCKYKESEHGFQLAQEYDNFEIHCRPSLWRYQYEHGANWVAKDIFKNVATGASVTGFVRAHLLRAMYSVGIGSVVYCDTDSIIALPSADFKRLPITDNLGDWELEDHSAPVGYFAGKKLYAVQLSAMDRKTGKQKHKVASKGAKLSFKDVKEISEGKTITWENDAPVFNILGAVDHTEKGREKDKKRLEFNDPKRRHSLDDSARFVKRRIRQTATIEAA